ncbi:methyltransferase [Streptomyces nigrescens]|uniref:Methyltransferase n=1 Tax=Streptomyces nigrescens TaxID=1920 RepID=A0ABM7ZXY9_STRNI|nr:methyltransferase [Streptomyces nigrescens]
MVSFGSVPLANAFLDPATSYEDEARFPLGVISCRSCRLMSLTHVVDPEVMYRTYFYVTSDSESITRHMRYVAQTCTSRFALGEDELVVEMGSNTGAQLLAFRPGGQRVLGVDPALNLAATANAHGVLTLPEYFSDRTAARIRNGHGQARLILGRHVFAHVDDLADVAAGVRRLLARDGVFAIEVPYALDLVERVAFDTVYHEHLSYFLVGTLAELFDRHGLRLFDVERLPVHGGSILAFVGLREGPWEQQGSVAELFAAEQAAGLHQDAAYGEFAHKVARVRQELPRLVRGLVAQGARVAGYGASAKGTTLLNICGIGADELQFCSDTTVLKQGKVLPGTHVPVCSPQSAAAEPPDYYLLLAWNYADEILEKERRFLDNGGRFILPVPEPVVLSAGARATTPT